MYYKVKTILNFFFKTTYLYFKIEGVYYYKFMFILVIKNLIYKRTYLVEASYHNILCIYIYIYKSYVECWGMCIVLSQPNRESAIGIAPSSIASSIRMNASQYPINGHVKLCQVHWIWLSRSRTNFLVKLAFEYCICNSSALENK